MSMNEEKKTDTESEVVTGAVCDMKAPWKCSPCLVIWGLFAVFLLLSWIFG